MKIIDLSVPIDQNTPAYPGDPKVELNEIAKIESHGWNEKRLSMNSHSSTHIDAPFHMIENGKKLSEYSLDRFYGDGIVIKAVGKKTLGKELLKGKEIKGKIVLFMTGHSKKLYQNYFDDYPEITTELAEEIVNQKASIIGVDFASPDKEPYNLHKLLFKNDILIIENLCNLDKIKKEKFKIMAFPLNLQNADGAPCRVVAMED